MFNRLRKRAKEAMEKLRRETEKRKKVALGKEEMPELESKKEQVREVSEERAKPTEALERLEAAGNSTLLKDYDKFQAFCDIRIVLRYLMKKETKR